MKRKESHTKKTSLIIITLLLLICIPEHPIKECRGTKTTIYVDDSGGADYKTIQQGVNAANNGE